MWDKHRKVLALTVSILSLGILVGIILTAVYVPRDDEPIPLINEGNSSTSISSGALSPAPSPRSFESTNTSFLPSSWPSAPPVIQTSSEPSTVPSHQPSSEPSRLPTVNPSTGPSTGPSSIPTVQPSTIPSPIQATYVPGELSVNQLGLLLSTGLSARLLATSGQRVRYDFDNSLSNVSFHGLPDYGTTFSDKRLGNEGGWIYVSNSENKKPRKRGGVGAFTFNKDGKLLEYKMILEGTTGNCAGGRTPWGSYISCEEYNRGVIWQVDPTGERPGRQITLGSEGGFFESFAYDDRPSPSHYFVTEDHQFGALQRFIPSVENTTDPWDELHGEGQTRYLILHPTSSSEGTYEWTDNKSASKTNANLFYPNAEGLDVHEDQLFFVSKRLKTLFVLNLDGTTYTSHTTRRGLFNGQPDQLQRILGPSGETLSEDLLYFTEDGGKYAGIHARNRDGDFFTILESEIYSNETTGLAFSPNGLHMYIAYQDEGVLFEITRDDGLPFHAKSLAIKFHATRAD